MKNGRKGIDSSIDGEEPPPFTIGGEPNAYGLSLSLRLSCLISSYPYVKSLGISWLMFYLSSSLFFI